MRSPVHLRAIGDYRGADRGVRKGKVQHRMHTILWDIKQAGITVSRGLSPALSARGSRGMFGKQQPSSAEIGVRASRPVARSAAALIVRCTPAAVRQAWKCGRGLRFTNAVALLLALKERRTIAL